ncbi:hypothetical protein DNTS_014239, partial [Danionella cerebrum]
MSIEEYLEEDEEPPLLLRCCPSDPAVVLGDSCRAVSVGGRVCVSCLSSWTGTHDAVDPVEGSSCRFCPSGSFSPSLGSEPCLTHTSCRKLNRWTVTAPTSYSDAECGGCLPGFHLAAALPSSSVQACVKNASVRRRRNVNKSTSGAPSRSGATGSNSTSLLSPDEKEKGTEYAVFALVPVFCVMGLLGILICNLLKKKGFRCNAEKDGVHDEAATPQKDGNSCPYIVDDPNEDTISILVRLITEKKENAAALEELLQEYEDKQMALNKTSSIKFAALPVFPPFRALPRLCSHQHHLHTISGLASRSGLSCSRCSQKKWPELLLPPQKLKSPSIQSKAPEINILSVGRFQVAQIPELKACSERETPPGASDTDSVDSSQTEPAEERSLLGVTSSSSPISFKSRQEFSERERERERE